MTEPIQTLQALATTDQLIGAGGRRRYRRETLPISGLLVRIQSLTERELSQYQSAVIASSGAKLQRARLEDASRRLIVRCLVDEAGNRLLADSHVGRLADWDAADTAYLYEACAAHVGVNRTDIEDLVKNSDAIPDGSIN